MGIARTKPPAQLGLYYDFFKLPHSRYLFLIAESSLPGIESGIYISSLRGMIRALIQSSMSESAPPLSATTLFASLNRMLCEDLIRQQFGMSVLILDTLRDTLSFSSCKLGSLLHLPQGSNKSRRLPSQNPLLGEDLHAEFLQTTDNWNVGDTLVFHSLAEGADDALLASAASEYAFISAQRQADAILKRIAASLSQARTPQALFTIQRLS
jgi:serine phosphatase RsbU (regulator of sigma subunit)